MSEVLDFEKQSHKVPQHKQHYRALMEKPLLVAEEFGGKDVTMTIARVEQEELTSQRGSEKKIVLYFEETHRSIALNITNCRSIAEVTGTPFVGEWVGHKITFYPEDITAFGKRQQCIRIRTK